VSTAGKKRFDGKTFFGLCMGGGSAIGMLVKAYIALEGGTSPFWMWAALGLVLALSALILLQARRERAELRRRIERSSLSAEARRRAAADEGIVAEVLDERASV
jgi:hypothetical protein